MNVRVFRYRFALLAIFSAFVLSNSSANAEFVEPDIMDGFPYANKPFHAATTFAVAKVPKSDQLKFSRTVLFPDRVHLEAFDTQNGIMFNSKVQRGLAELVFIVPGFGGTGVEASTESIASNFYKAGFHVATLPSPLSWSFARHVSRSAIPGNFTEDAKDLFAAAKQVEEVLRTRRGAKISGYRFVGYSYGGLTVAHLRRLNKDGAYFKNVRRYISINPPVSMEHAMATLNSYVALGSQWPRGDQSRIYNYVWGRFADKLQEEEFSDTYYHNLNGVERLKVEVIQWLIQYTFRDSLSSVIYTADKINDLKLLPRATSGNRSAAYSAAKRWTFNDYTEKMLPLAFPGDTRNPWDILVSQGLIEAIGSESASDFTVLHNRNDFLVTEADLEVLKATLNRLGGKLVLFSDGGHMGNYWWPAWQAELVKAASE